MLNDLPAFADLPLSRRSVNTNDAFVGIDSYDLETTKLYPPAYDAGKTNR